MIVQRMMVRGLKTAPYAWRFMVDTEASAQGEKKTGIPVNLYNQTSAIDVDWGDGTTSSLSSADYTETDNLASVHEYASAGIYTITLSCRDWENTYLLGLAAASDITGDDINGKLSCLYWFRRSLIAFSSPFPNVMGTKCYSSLSGTTLYDYLYFPYFFYLANHVTGFPSDFLSLLSDKALFMHFFYGMKGITTIPEGFLSSLTECQSCEGLFKGCPSLASIPNSLFTNNLHITNLSSCFDNCAALGDFSIHIASRDVSRVSSFVTSKAGTTRTIYVPAGSTTETTFNAVATDLGLTIIGE